MNSEVVVINPPVETLLKLANEEQHSRMKLFEYEEVIAVLVKKGFSGRKILAWLEEHGAGRYSSSQLSKVVTSFKEE